MLTEEYVADQRRDVVVGQLVAVEGGHLLLGLQIAVEPWVSGLADHPGDPSIRAPGEEIWSLVVGCAPVGVAFDALAFLVECLETRVVLDRVLSLPLAGREFRRSRDHVLGEEVGDLVELVVGQLGLLLPAAHPPALADLAEMSRRLRVCQERTQPGAGPETGEVRGGLLALPLAFVEVAAQALLLQDGPAVGQGIAEQDKHRPVGRDADLRVLRQQDGPLGVGVGLAAGFLKLRVAGVGVQGLIQHVTRATDQREDKAAGEEVGQHARQDLVEEREAGEHGQDHRRQDDRAEVLAITWQMLEELEQRQEIPGGSGGKIGASRGRRARRAGPRDNKGRAPRAPRRPGTPPGRPGTTDRASSGRPPAPAAGAVTPLRWKSRMWSSRKKKTSPGSTATCSAKNRVTVWLPKTVPPTATFRSVAPITGTPPMKFAAILVDQYPVWSQGSWYPVAPRPISDHQDQTDPPVHLARSTDKPGHEHLEQVQAGITTVACEPKWCRPRMNQPRVMTSLM